MPTLATMQLPPPESWQEFEDLCLDVWRELWHDPNAHKNGRQGQPQAGVDVFGRPGDGLAYSGVQCKREDNTLMKHINEREIRAEVEKAKSFVPALSCFTIATTGPRDEHVQQIARELTLEHKSVGLFSVDVWFWEDIRKELAGHEPLVRKHYLQLFQTTEASLRLTDEVRQIIKDEQKGLLDSVAEVQRTVERQIGITPETSAALLQTEHGSEMAYAKRLIDTHMPKQAIDFLEDLRTRAWDTGTSIFRFKLLTNLGASLLNLNKTVEAGKLFVEALQFNPNDEKALANSALGFYLVGNLPNARSMAEKAKVLNPSNATILALTVEMAEPTESVMEVVEKIPEPLRGTLEVAYSIGVLASKRGDLNLAERWFRDAVANDHSHNPDAKAALGDLLIKRVVESEINSVSESLPSTVREQLQEGVLYLSEAWDSLAETDMRAERVDWLVNRSIAKKALGDTGGAISDIDLALSVKQDDPRLKKQRAIYAFETDDYPTAIGLLQSIVSRKETPEASLVLAEVLRQAKRIPEAIELLVENLKGNPTLELAQHQRAILVRMYLEIGDDKNAELVTEEMRKEEPSNLNVLIESANVAKARGRTSDVIALLREAMRNLSHKTGYFDRLRLANELYATELFDEAAEVYKSIADVTRNDQVTQRLIHSFYRAGNSSEALKICKSLRLLLGASLRLLAELESAINEGIGDLPEARTICEAYLTIHPEDDEIKVRLATILMRMGQYLDADKAIEAVREHVALGLNYRQQLVSLFVERNQFSRAVKLAYDTRRKFFDKAEAHLQYVSLIFSRESDSETLESPAFVKEDSVVTLKNNRGNQVVFLLENRPEADSSKRELNLDHPTAKKLLGKKVGDLVDLIENPLQPLHEEIVDIKSKYVHALHDTLESFERLFPGHEGLHSLWINPEGTSDQLRDEVKNLLTQTQASRPQIEEFYKQGKITIGGFAALIKRDLLAVWVGLMSNRELGIVCSSGDPRETEKAVESLAAIPILVIDPLSLLTIFHLKLGDQLKVAFEDLLVAQTTVDLLNMLISERRLYASRGSLTVYTEAGELFKQEVSPDQAKKGIESLQVLLEWVKGNCRVTASRMGLNIRRDKKTQLDKFLGSSFVDSVFIASAENHMLLSEDLTLRRYAKQQYNVSSVWIQAILLHMLQKGLLKRADYIQAVVLLSSWHYYHTSIDDSVLIEAARQSDWLPKFPFIEVLSILSGNRSNVESAIVVAINFLYEIWKQPILPQARDQIVFSLLGAISTYRNRYETLGLLERNVKTRFVVWPTAEQHILSLIGYWRRVNPL